MHLLITGGTGFIGVPLVEALLARGDQITLLSRNFAKAKRLFNGRVSLIGSVTDAIIQVDSVINLAGEPIMDKRWTQKRKTKLRESRIGVTEQIIDWISKSEIKPNVLVSGSAIGYYGNYPESVELDESAEPRHCFSSELCRDWEAMAFKAQEQGVRVCTVRTGIVLAKHGGALKRMWLPFAMGLGGPIGSGNQWFSWIHLQDMVNLLIYLVDNPEISGPVNGTALMPVTNAEFSKRLAKALNRPALLPMPVVVVKLLFGEAGELLLEGQRVVPEKAVNHGYRFKFLNLTSALEDIVKS